MLLQEKKVQEMFAVKTVEKYLAEDHRVKGQHKRIASVTVKNKTTHGHYVSSTQVRTR